MISLKLSKDKLDLSKADYVLDKTDKFYDMVRFLTPKFYGQWTFYLLDPTIKFVKDLLKDINIPAWIDVYIITNQKKIDEISLDYPDMVPKKQTKKEAFDMVVAGLTHLLDKSAARALFEAFKQKPDETTEAILKLDKETKELTITKKDIQGAITYTKPIYASEVMNAFLHGDANRWVLYNKLINELGESYAYYALRKYLKNLLHNKEQYLENKDYKYFIVQSVDSPTICYAYVLFANSTSPKQLYSIMWYLEHRGNSALDFVLANAK